MRKAMLVHFTCFTSLFPALVDQVDFFLSNYTSKSYCSFSKLFKTFLIADNRLWHPKELQVLKLVKENMIRKFTNLPPRGFYKVFPHSIYDIGGVRRWNGSVVRKLSLIIRNLSNHDRQNIRHWQALYSQQTELGCPHSSSIWINLIVI